VEDERSPERDLLAPTDWTVPVDGVDEAAQLELYSVADRQPRQLNQSRRDMVGATQAVHMSSSCILDAL